MTDATRSGKRFMTPMVVVCLTGRRVFLDVLRAAKIAPSAIGYNTAFGAFVWGDIPQMWYVICHQCGIVYPTTSPYLCTTTRRK